MVLSYTPWAFVAIMEKDENHPNGKIRSKPELPGNFSDLATCRHPTGPQMPAK
jgi:hypothetical protein